MGCCVSKGYSYEVDLFDQDLLTLEDLNLIKIVDTAEDVVEALDIFYKKYNLSPNF